uniref:DUF19 domain-containing protein n=1 Tax=Meloidogyne hapla TaxID=6305 RepID=A0A1I8AZZ9_MELHA
MSTNPPKFFFFLFLIYSPFNAGFEGNSTVCSSDAFFCPINGNCIPFDWVGDGEPDCEDGADEKLIFNNRSNNAINENNKQKAETNNLLSKQKEQPETLIDWLVQMESELPNLFTHSKQSAQLLLKGCQFLDNKNQSNSVGGPWARLQVFLCELLTPALLDQPECLSSTNQCSSPKLFFNETSSIISLPCALLTQSVAHFSCIEANPPSECSESALEMLAPLRQESEHWFGDLSCNDTTKQQKQLNIQPWDVLTILSNAEMFCKKRKTNGKNEFAAPIWAKLNNQLNSSCAMLEAFNNNIDCSIRSLNELCPIKAQEAVVSIQEQLNDEAISQQCFQYKEEEPEKSTEKNKFILRPLNGQCSEEQEENALLCLSELSGLPSRLQKLSSLGALFSNQTALIQVCSLFEHYQKCLQDRVFPNSWNSRCALNSPMNALASAVLQGIPNGSAHLCKAFYSLREAFDCAKMTMNEFCFKNETLIDEFNSLLDKVNSIGLEEGCPSQPPLNFDSFLKISPISTVPTNSLPSQFSIAPMARPMPKEVDEMSQENECPSEQQQQFQSCVQPLSAFQPHPLSVIKNPRQIGDACLAFTNFTKCCEGLAPNCIPLWARGLAAMFEFACGEGNQRFIELRQCLRRSTARPELHECVLSFSKASPREACTSAKHLLECAVPSIESKCGFEAGQFEREYVGRFAKALDPNCSLEGSHGGELAVFSGHDCSSDQKHLIQQCSAPLGDLRSQLDKMFQGGLQSVLKNFNGLSTLFQKGCILSYQFRKCVSSLLSTTSNCTISSCLVASGAGICDQKDVGEAIDSNLGCVFKQVLCLLSDFRKNQFQVSNPDFGQCIRQHLGPLRQLNLSGLRSVLPNFVDCVQPIVLKQCGNVPLNVLRVLASNGNCPKIEEKIEVITTTTFSTPKCTEEMRKNRQNCQNQYLLSKYEFTPITLLNISFDKNNTELNLFCSDLDKLEECERETNACDLEEPYGLPRAMRAFSIYICSSRTEYIQISNCLLNIQKSEEGQNCLNLQQKINNTEEFCFKINKTSHCISSKIFQECGNEALDFVFSASNEFVGQLVPSSKCRLETPAISLQTGCTEQQLVNYLECETGLDRFRPRPISLISNQTQWDDFCSNAYTKFRRCVEVLECRPEPATKATLTLYETVCEREITRRDQRQFGNCLFNITETEKGQKCLNEFRCVDLLAKGAGENVCKAINKLLQCLAIQINNKCGEEALLHVFDLNNIWANEFYKGCSLSPPEIEREEKKMLPKIDFSSDQMSTNEPTKEEIKETTKLNIENKTEKEIQEKLETDEEEKEKNSETTKSEIWAEEEEEEKVVNTTEEAQTKDTTSTNSGRTKHNRFDGK